MASPAKEVPAVQPHPRDFNAWMKAEQRRVFLLCYRLLRERDEADTATQEVFLKAYRVLNRIEAQAPEQPARWLTKVAVNTCLDRLRSRRWQFWRRRVRNEDERDILGMARDVSPNAEQSVLAGEISKRLTAAMSGLSERQRTVFVLRHFEDLSLEEIARSLGLDIGTVKAHLSRALSKLRSELRDLYLVSGGNL